MVRAGDVSRTGGKNAPEIPADECQGTEGRAHEHECENCHEAPTDPRPMVLVGQLRADQGPSRQIRF